MRKLALLFIVSFPAFTSLAQSLDIEAMVKETKLKVNGGLNANAIFYNSNFSQSREPFTYMITGSLNFGFATFSLPFSYAITNQGESFDYKVPFDFNRFSLTPQYKWIKAYLGDNAMSFSKYTLNGHPFRGFGVELTPKGHFKFASMGGRLLKAVQGNDSLGIPSTYERHGYGAIAAFAKNRHKVEAIGFYAKDNEKSAINTASAVPMTNYVGSLKLTTILAKKIQLEGEYAVSVLESRIPLRPNDTVTFPFNYDKSKTHNKAFNARINYSIRKASVGLVYENIDPAYRTFGAMYFNNDLENVGLTFASPFFRDRFTVATQLGFQRDNLDDKNNQTTIRFIGNLNASLKVSEKLNFSGSYSNFSTTTNRRLSQFEYINLPEMSPADTLDYQQLSQAGNFNANYIFGKKKNQNLNLHYSVAAQANRQGGVIRQGQASTVQNYNLTHSITFSQSRLGLNTSLNYTSNNIGTADNSAIGTSLGLAKKFFNNKLNTSLGSLYNQTNGRDPATSKVFGFRLNTNYTLIERHIFSLYGIQMFRKTAGKKNVNDLTVNLNYNYSF